MESIAAPVEALAEKAAWFARAREIRLLHVATSVDLREAVLKHLLAQEFHSDNRSPYYRQDEAHHPEDAGWVARAQRLRLAHERRREVMAREGLVLPALPLAPREQVPLALFAAQVYQVLHARCAPLEGLVVVLAPTRVDKPTAFETDIRQLVRSPRLKDVRWVVVQVEGRGMSALLEELGPAGMRAECWVDEAAQRKELARMLDSAAAAGADAPGPAQVGAAWPREVKPPARKGRPSAQDLAAQAQTLEAAGVPAAFVLGGGNGVRSAVLRAAQSLREARPADAVHHQREALRLCVAMKLVREAVLLELVLGSYLLHAGEKQQAALTYEAAARRAREAKLPQQEAQAWLAMGALHVVEGQRPESVGAYARAGRVAHEGGIPLLAIEGWRMAGHVAADAGFEKHAAELWREALAVAAGVPAAEAAASSAAEVARALAALCRKRGLLAQAEALEAQSVRLDGAAPKLQTVGG